MRHYKENSPFITNPARKSRIGVEKPGDNRRGSLKESRNFPTVSKRVTSKALRSKNQSFSLMCVCTERVGLVLDQTVIVAADSQFKKVSSAQPCRIQPSMHHMPLSLSLWPSIPWMNLTTSLVKLLPASFGCGPGSPFSHHRGRSPGTSFPLRKRLFPFLSDVK